MKCYSCNNEIDSNDYCVCIKCRRRACPSCAQKNAYVCENCGGDMAYLS